MTPKRRALLIHPGATCKKEGQVYVVRNVYGGLITARLCNSHAWAIAITVKPSPTIGISELD